MNALVGSLTWVDFVVRCILVYTVLINVHCRKKIGFLSSVIVVVLIVEPEISSKWSWLNSVVITTSIVSNTTTTNGDQQP